MKSRDWTAIGICEYFFRAGSCGSGPIIAIGSGCADGSNGRHRAMKKEPLLVTVVLLTGIVSGCAGPEDSQAMVQNQQPQAVEGTPEYFLLRPEVEKAYGYTHAIRIGNDIKISGAVSMDDEGNPTAIGDLEQQMKNAYSDLEKVLDHYGYTFDDVIVENVFTTDMAGFLEVAGYRSSIYGERFPTGSWLEVKGLALPEFLIEIELEAHKSR
jgi:2-iminobutanoate/2-iminopropanoate deaminase